MTLSRSMSTKLSVFSFLIGWRCILMRDSRLRPWNTPWWFSSRYFWYLSHKEACLMWNPFSVNSPKISFVVVKILKTLQIKAWFSYIVPEQQQSNKSTSLNSSNFWLLFLLFIKTASKKFWIQVINELLNIPLSNCCWIDLNSSLNSSGNVSELRLTDWGIVG